MSESDVLAPQRWNTNWALLLAWIPTATSQYLWFKQGSFISVKNTSDAGILDSLLIYYWPLKQEIDLWRPLKICILIDTQVKSSCLGVFANPLRHLHAPSSASCRLMICLLSVTAVPCPALSVTLGCCKSNTSKHLLTNIQGVWAVQFVSAPAIITLCYS